jgi:hypothetical protein
MTKSGANTRAWPEVDIERDSRPPSLGYSGYTLKIVCHPAVTMKTAIAAT